MRYNRKKDVSPKYLLLFLTVICVAFLILSYVASDKIAFVKRYTSKIVTPLQKGVNEFGLWTDSKLDNLKEIDELNKENEKLKDEIARLELEVSTYQNQLDELEALQELYALDELYPDFNKTGAHVFAKDTTSWFSVFYIDKGKNQGIEKGANVLSGEGLVGIVIESYDDYAKVRSIIDDKSNISARIIPSNAFSTVEGSISTYDEGYIIAKNIDKDANVSIGDKLVTSNISDRYHPGLTIGYVMDIENDSNNLTMTARIAPVVNFSNISEVLVITDQKKSITED